jgi:hypothetical protein
MTLRSRKLAAGAVAVVATFPFLMAAHAPVNSGIQGETANQIVTAAESAMKGLKSFHVEGVFSTLTMDLSLSSKGGGGTITEGGATLHIVVAKGWAYIKADEQSWLKLMGSAGSVAIAEELANKWIKVALSNADFADFADLTISGDFVKEVFNGHQSGLSVASGTTKINGQKAVQLSDGQGDFLYVANSAPHYILRVTGTGSSAGSLNFGDFGDAKLPSVPTNAISLPGV